jgi:hypothetical protein
LLTGRRAAPPGLVTFSISPLNLLLIIDKAWRAAGEGKFKTLQITLLPSACLIRLKELYEDCSGTLVGFKKVRGSCKVILAFLRNGK